MRTIRTVSLAVLTFLALDSAICLAEGVYRWTDNDGVVHYSDNPPAPNAKPTDLPPIQTFAPSAITNGRPLPGTSGPQAMGDVPVVSRDVVTTGYKPMVTSPGAEETIRESEGNITISVAPSPPAGVLLIYNLDGKPLNLSSPTPAASYVAHEVERGEHKVSVTAVAKDGRTVGQSPSITFYMMPPKVPTPPPPKGKH
jgi:hypothetical protein